MDRKIGLFIPCYIDAFFPEVGVATLELLERLGFSVEYPLGQTCCGQPMANSGCQEDSAATEAHFVQCFQDFNTIVGPSGSCVHHVRFHLDAIEQTPRVRSVRAGTRELVEFLHDDLKVADFPWTPAFPHKVGLHDSCSTVRGLGHTRPSELVNAPYFSKTRDLLGKVRDIELIEIDRRDECCGFGGSISAYVVDSAPEVSGQVVEVAVRDNQFVKTGDLLYRIDPRDYQAALQRADANVAQAEADLSLARTSVPLADAKHQFQIYELSRIRGLASKADSADYELNQAQRDFDVTAVALDQAKKTIASREAGLEAAKAALYKARIDLERCEIRTPVNGWVTNLTVRVGNYADAGKQQMSVIDADSYWITGYFEETKIKHIRVGAQATAVLMGYTDMVLRGHVESINRGIADPNLTSDQKGLPQVNPVFTWVRLAQRIPVRIHIDDVPDGVHIAVAETCTVHVER